MNARRRRTPPGWVISGVLCGVFVLLGLTIPVPGHRLDYSKIENGRGRPLRVVTYFPQPAVYERAPAAVIIQPLNNPPEASRLLALELVGDGFVVLTFDWRGRAAEENRQLVRKGVQELLRADVAAAVEYLRALESVNPDRIALAGHSVGGTLAIEAAMVDPRIMAVASIGMEADVTLTAPRNLLWVVGLYDEFRVLNRMRDTFRASAATSAMEETTVGNFAAGTARRLSVSPTADHFTELQDRNIHRAVREWFAEAAGLPAPGGGGWMPLRAILQLAAWLAGLVAALFLLRRIPTDGRFRVKHVPGFAGLAAVLAAGMITGGWFLFATDAVVWLTLLVLVRSFTDGLKPDASRNLGRKLARMAGIFWASVLVTLAVNSLAYYVQQPGYLLRLPEFAVTHLLSWFYFYLTVHPKPLWFAVYGPEGVDPRLWVYIVLGVETFFPGILLGWAARWAQRKKPQQEATQAKVRKPLPKLQLVLLAGLLGFLGVVGWLRLEQGFLTRESALAALRFMLRFAVLPMFVFSLLWRWQGKTAGAPTE